MTRSAVALVLLLAACNPVKDLRLTTRAVEAFHRQLEAGQYEMIYDNADPVFRSSMSRDIQTKFLSRVKRKMGTCQSGSLTGFNETTNMNGTFINVGYQLPCSTGTLVESFSFHIVNGTPNLTSYSAQNPALLVD